MKQAETVSYIRGESTWILPPGSSDARSIALKRPILVQGTKTSATSCDGIAISDSFSARRGCPPPSVEFDDSGGSGAKMYCQVPPTGLRG